VYLRGSISILVAVTGESHAQHFDSVDCYQLLEPLKFSRQFFYLLKIILNVGYFDLVRLIRSALLLSNIAYLLYP